jgi:hypothetical protein
VEHKHLEFALALVLDELARHVRELHPDVRAQTLRGAQMLLGGTMPSRRVLGDPIAIYTWLLVTLAGVVAALVTGQAVLAVIGWAVGGLPQSSSRRCRRGAVGITSLRVEPLAV